jgi:hypothetical protein
MMRFLIFSFAAVVATQALGHPLVPDQLPDTEGWRVYSSVQAWDAADAVPVKNISEWTEHLQPRSGKNIFVQRHKAEAGVIKDGWLVGLEYRKDVTAVIAGDTLELVRRQQQKTLGGDARSYPLEGKYQAWSGSGIRVGHVFSLSDQAAAGPRLLVSAALYQQVQYREVGVGGQVAYQSADNYQVQAQMQDANPKKQYPFMQSEPDASGYSVSATLDWPLSENLHARMQLNDLAGRIKLKNVPVTTTRIDTDAAYLDDQNHINYRPLLSGRNVQQTGSERIPPTSALSLSYQADRWLFSGGLFRVADTVIPNAAVEYAFRWMTVGASYESRFNTVGLMLRRGPFQLNVASNSRSLDKATSLALSASLNYAF